MLHKRELASRSPPRWWHNQLTQVSLKVVHLHVYLVLLALPSPASTCAARHASHLSATGLVQLAATQGTGGQASGAAADHTDSMEHAKTKHIQRLPSLVY